MTNYEDESRGTYQNRDYARQIISFEGMKFKGSKGKLNVTPTDIDGFIQLNNENAYIFFELKHGNPHLPNGQGMALKNLVNALNEAGKNAVLFIAYHTSDSEADVIAADAIVDRFYDAKGWHQCPENVKAPLYRCISNWLAKEKTA